MESHVNEVLAALRDPMGVPLYPVVFQLLMVLTFALHILFVNFVVGGLLISLWGRFRRAERWHPARGAPRSRARPAAVMAVRSRRTSWWRRRCT